jgi:phosphoribosylformimino-5-aminoimidazole carboxamide ribotide isomerase
VELFPAIDLHAGGAVRLVQGDFARVRDFGDPVVLARRYADGGARWVHVVDLDAARTGQPHNRAVVLDLVARIDVRVQVGGGLRHADDAAVLLEGGVERVVLGTAAFETPDVVAALTTRYPGRIAVGLDHRGVASEVALRGWEKPSGVTLDHALEQLAGFALAAVVVTAIDRDGTMEGPDVPGLARVLERSPHPVVASGGVRSPGDLEQLAALESGGRRLAGAIVGTALAEQTMSVEEAIAACAPSG